MKYMHLSFLFNSTLLMQLSVSTPLTASTREILCFLIHLHASFLKQNIWRTYKIKGIIRRMTLGNFNISLNVSVDPSGPFCTCGQVIETLKADSNFFYVFIYI